MPLPRKILPFAAVLLLAVTPAFGQIRSEPPLAAGDAGLILTTQGQRLVLPAPDWVAADASGEVVMSSFEAVFRSDDTDASLEFYRKGAVYALAKELYGAHVLRDGGATPASYRDSVIDGFGRACAPGLSAFVQLGDDPDDVTAPLLLICGMQRADTRQGEIMAMNLQASETGLAVVYQQWRGAAFNPEQSAQWPATPEIIEARARQLHNETALTPAE